MRLAHLTHVHVLCSWEVAADVAGSSGLQDERPGGKTKLFACQALFIDDARESCREVVIGSPSRPSEQDDSTICRKQMT